MEPLVRCDYCTSVVGEPPWGSGSKKHLYFFIDYLQINFFDLCFVVVVVPVVVLLLVVLLLFVLLGLFWCQVPAFHGLPLLCLVHLALHLHVLHQINLSPPGMAVRRTFCVAGNCQAAVFFHPLRFSPQLTLFPFTFGLGPGFRIWIGVRVAV